MRGAKKALLSDPKRAFFMGNALVVGVVEKLGKQLASRIEATSFSEAR